MVHVMKSIHMREYHVHRAVHGVWLHEGQEGGNDSCGSKQSFEVKSGKSSCNVYVTPLRFELISRQKIFCSSALLTSSQDVLTCFLLLFVIQFPRHKTVGSSDDWMMRRSSRVPTVPQKYSADHESWQKSSTTKCLALRKLDGNIMRKHDSTSSCHLLVHHNYSSPSTKCRPSLADRVKSNKRQRDEQKESKRESKHSSKSSKDHQERPSKSRQAEDENTVLTSNTRQVVCNTNQKSSSKMRDEVRVPKVHKSSSSSQVKTSSSSGGNNYISSSYLSASSSSSKPQLTSQSLSLPPPEKLEAMMDELFDLNKIGSGGHHHQSSSKHHKNHKKGSDGDSTEDEDDEDQLQQDHYDHSDEDSDGGRRRKRLKKSCKSSKKSGAKTNGDLQSEMAIFDITLSESTLTTFVSLTAKLKRSNQTSGATASKISSLLTVLTQQISIQSAGLKDRRRRSSVDDSNQSDEDQDEDSGNITTSQSLMHKFESCCDCCLVALYILSSRGLYPVMSLMILAHHTNHSTDPTECN